jgi:DNA-binding transcriptional LysR family regulator
MRDLDWQIIATLHSERNITKVAELLFITQPALTKRIQQIENELGTALITRSTKGVAFTSEGEYAAARAREILALIDDVKQHIEQTNLVEGGGPQARGSKFLCPLCFAVSRETI